MESGRKDEEEKRKRKKLINKRIKIKKREKVCEKMRIKNLSFSYAL
jgi:hypothetical protein